VHQADDLAVLAAIEAEEAYCRANVRHFIEHYIWIEDKTVPEKVARFLLWPVQTATLDTFLVQRFIIALKARQLGFTWLALAYAVWRMLFTPGYTVVAISKTDDDAIELVDYRLAHILLPRLPRWLIRHRSDAPPGWSGPIWDSTKHEITIQHPGGDIVSRFRADAGPDAGRSLTADLGILDEWAANQWAPDIWQAAYPTINRPGTDPEHGQVMIISTNERGSLFEEQVIAARKEQNAFYLIFWPWTADPRRTPEWHEATKRNMPNSHRLEYPGTIDDALSAGEATALPEYDDQVGGPHVCEPFPIPRWWRRWRSNDPGHTDPFAWYWLAAGEDGVVYIYREWTREPSDPRVAYSEQARRVVALSIVGSEVRRPELDPESHQPIQEVISFTVTGMDAFNRHPETGKAIVNYYAEGGVKGCIQPVHGPGSRAAMLATWHEYLRVTEGPDGRPTSKIRIFSTCEKLRETLPKLIVDENHPEQVADLAIDHWYQAAGYGLQAWHAKRSQSPPQEKSVVAAHKEKIARARTRRRLA
jgi:hypothetical protein